MVVQGGAVRCIGYQNGLDLLMRPAEAESQSERQESRNRVSSDKLTCCLPVTVATEGAMQSGSFLSHDTLQAPPPGPLTSVGVRLRAVAVLQPVAPRALVAGAAGRALQLPVATFEPLRPLAPRPLLSTPTPCRLPCAQVPWKLLPLGQVYAPSTSKPWLQAPAYSPCPWGPVHTPRPWALPCSHPPQYDPPSSKLLVSHAAGRGPPESGARRRLGLSGGSGAASAAAERAASHGHAGSSSTSSSTSSSRLPAPPSEPAELAGERGLGGSGGPGGPRSGGGGDGVDGGDGGGGGGGGGYSDGAPLNQTLQHPLPHRHTQRQGGSRRRRMLHWYAI
ncbi:hypothetical protein EYF80_040311 [Liparis tanakae]|uniref:Uncharacterized protein n=1 Tax=Liparis tanakae TaxID=230148 RepID=A0A4Z2G8M1_9TELE|nr:hypothetical protein EYF80_040311 [Liparis tanakae]